jgi:hypothetical protein
MKSKIISVLILSTILLVSITSILAISGLSKPKPNPNPELITFIGDLEGSQEVVGCCPNAGPCPEYTLTLSALSAFPDEMKGKHEGNIFMNFFGAGKNKQSYLVKFSWTTEDDTEYFIDIRGGNIDQDRKAKILTVTFDKVPCEIWINDDPTAPATVSFTLTREQL